MSRFHSDRKQPSDSLRKMDTVVAPQNVTGNGTSSNALSRMTTMVAPEHLTAPAIIKKKRDGHELTDHEIGFMIDGVCSKDKIGMEQVGAWLMAIWLKGLNTRETVNLTTHMLHSGAKLSWPEDRDRPLVDKHSTGGIGDKITLPLAPALAACGVRAPLLAGRGLGHTGGTLDKLDSIKGFKSQISVDLMQKVISDPAISCVICGQTSEICPADRLLYATRDVTSTVDSVPLITASIVSKKAAAGADVMVLDVKCGEGAFMKNIEDARVLAKSLISCSEGMGVKTQAVLTHMDDPIGRCVGNSLEVVESIEVMQGAGPRDTVELVCALGGQALVIAGKATSFEEGRGMIDAVLKNGKALERFKRLALACGANAKTVEKMCGDDPSSAFPQAECVTDIPSTFSGTIRHVLGMPVAEVANACGAGRKKAADSVNFSVGIEVLKYRGDTVAEGEATMRVHHTGDLSPEQIEKLQAAVVKCDKGHEVPHRSRVIEILTIDDC